MKGLICFFICPQLAKVELLAISCEMDEGSSSEKSKNTATLLCSAKPQKPESLMKIEWNSQGILHHGPKLPITLGDQGDEVEHICSVSNPLSSEMASITAKECYNGKNQTFIQGSAALYAWGGDEKECNCSASLPSNVCNQSNMNMRDFQN